MKKFKLKLKQNHGLTLMEVLVVTLIFSFIIMGIYSVTLVGDRAWQTNSVKLELQQELRKAEEAMIYELRESGANSIDLSVPANGTWYNEITFKTASSVSGGSLVWDATATRFTLSGTQLQKIIGASTKIVSQNISSLQLRRLSTTPDILEVALQAQKTVPRGGTYQTSLNFNLQLRN